MKVKKFLLQDNVDRSFCGLVVFKNDVDLEDIENAIDYVKKAFPTSYTDKDVFKALDELGTYEFIDFHAINIVEY